MRLWKQIQCSTCHIMQKKGGFVTLRHNEVRDITTSLLNEVCKDVHKEPPLIQLTGETFEQRTANTSDEAR